MAPPELARDAPVADVVHPFVPGFEPDFGDDFDTFFVDGGDGFFGQRFGADEPLFRDERLDKRFAALAFAGIDGVVFDLFEQAERFEIGYDLLAGFVAIEPGVLAAIRGDLCVAADDFDERERVAFAGFEIVGIVRGGDFNDAGAEFGVGHFVENDGDLAIHQRQRDGLAVKIQIAFVARIDGDGGVSEHGFRTRGGNGEEAVGAGDGVADMPEVPGISSCTLSRSEMAVLQEGHQLTMYSPR